VSRKVVPYWTEAVASSLDEHGLKASDEQIAAIAADMEISAEMRDFGAPDTPSPYVAECERLRNELDAERRKETCRQCGGRGSITDQGPAHSSTSRCWKCNGEGRL